MALRSAHSASHSAAGQPPGAGPSGSAVGSFQASDAGLPADLPLGWGLLPVVPVQVSGRPVSPGWRARPASCSLVPPRGRQLMPPAG